MNRRHTLQIIAGSAAAIAALGLWARRWPIFRPAAPTGFYAAGEEALISAIADTIIPTIENLGAMGLEVDKFLIRYIERCPEPAEQELVKTQLAALDRKAREAHGQSFAACQPAQRHELLQALGTSANEAESGFFNLMKSLTIRGFSTSEEVMVKYQGYAIMPGHYHGCVEAGGTA